MPSKHAVTDYLESTRPRKKPNVESFGSRPKTKKQPLDVAETPSVDQSAGVEVTSSTAPGLEQPGLSDSANGPLKTEASVTEGPAAGTQPETIYRTATAEALAVQEVVDLIADAIDANLHITHGWSKDYSSSDFEIRKFWQDFKLIDITFGRAGVGPLFRTIRLGVPDSQGLYRQRDAQEELDAASKKREEAYHAKVQRLILDSHFDFTALGRMLEPEDSAGDMYAAGKSWLKNALLTFRNVQVVQLGCDWQHVREVLRLLGAAKCHFGSKYRLWELRIVIKSAGKRCLDWFQFAE